MPVPIVGPAYSLANKKADLQSSVNLHLVALEVPGKAKYILDSVPGLKTFSTLAGAARGALQTNDRAFVVFGSTLYEVMADGSHVSRGMLGTDSGFVSIAYGISQLVLVDGPNGYVLTLDGNVFSRITNEGFYGSPVVKFADNYFLFVRPETGQFYISAINDATSEDPADFATAESQPDNLVTIEVDHSEVYLFGQSSTEIWFNAGTADFPFQRSQGSSMEVGCMAAHSVRQIDNSIMWIGRDKNGGGIVYRAQGHQPVRISNEAVEQALAESTDLTAATAYSYQEKGRTFYCINAPGLKATWCYSVSSASWHTRCDLDEMGQFKAGRVQTVLYTFGKILGGGSDGVLYSLDTKTYKNGNDPLVRERVSPHEVIPGRLRLFFRMFWLDATTGKAALGVDPQAELSFSDDSGKSWSNPTERSLGQTGEAIARLLWTRLGSSFDRVWKIRCSADAPFSIIDAGSEAVKGTR